MRTLLGVCLCVVASTASAEKLCFVPFKGPAADTVRGQLADNLCASNACVDPRKATKAGKPDFAKAKKEKIDFFILGTVKAKGAKRTLELLVQEKPGAPKFKKAYPFTGNSLSDQTLENALAALSRGMGLQPPAAKEEPAKEEPKKEDPKKEEPKKEEPPKDEPEKKAEVTSKEEKRVAEPPPPPRDDEREKESKGSTDEEEVPKKKPVKPPLVALEAGVELFSRNFTYSGAETNNLRSYSAPLVIAPVVRVELYPLSLFTKGFVSGLGLDGSFGIAVGLKSRRNGTDTVWPTSLQWFDVSLRFRIRPIDGLDAAVIPFVGYSNRAFSVGKGSGGTLDGTLLDGLPNIAYSAIRPGIAGELPFSDSGFLIFARVAVMIALSSGQITTPPPDGFFRKGSNFGLEAQLGAGYRIVGPLSVRLAFDFTRYGLGFSTEATDPYRAGGAVDLYLGGTFSVRLTF